MNIFKKIIGLPNSALRSAARALLINRLRDCGSGKYGPGWQKAYDTLAGAKSITGFAIGATGFILMTLGYDDPADTAVTVVGGLLLAAGLADKAVNSPGRPEWAANSNLYRLLAEHAGWLATAFTSGFAYVTGASCTAYVIHGVTLTCATQGKVLLGIAAALAYIGVLDVGFLAQTPASLKAQAKRI
jgi:hypothetical protein